MTRRHKFVLALIMPLTAALVALLAAAFAQPVPPAHVSAVPPQFEVQRALGDALTFAADYPDRVVGSPASARAREWIVARFTELGLEVETLPFTVTVASEARSGVQVWATAPGEGDGIILVTAHYDAPRTEMAGLADNAPGVATLLELARLFAAAPNQRTLLFMASDSQVYGRFWGARSFITRFAQRGQIVAVLDLDHPGAQNSPGLALHSMGLRQGYAPLWLRQIGLEAVEAAGGMAADGDGVLEYIYRAIPLGASDASAYLRAGVPALSLSPESADAAGLGAYGRAAETWLRTVDALRPIPPDAAHYLRLNRAHHLAGDVIDYLQLLWFAPLFLATAMAWRGSRPQDRPRAGELRIEFTAFLGGVIAGLDGYAVAFSLVALGLLPRYEMHPAGPGDPFLLRPAWWAALLIYGTVAFFGWLIFRPFRGWGRLADLLDIPHRRLTLLLILCALVIVMWYVNGFAATALFGAAAYLWPWIEPRATPWGKGLNTLLALGGALPFAACVYVFSVNFPLGPWWWYFTLGAAYGLFSLVSVVVFICGAALLARFLQLGWRDK